MRRIHCGHALSAMHRNMSLSYTSRQARLSCATASQQDPDQKRLEGYFMKAIVCTQYGPPDVLQFAEVAKPTPKNDEVLIKIHAASVNPMDRFSMRGAPLIRLIPGLR